MKEHLSKTRPILWRTGCPLEFQVMTNKKFEEHEKKPDPAAKPTCMSQKVVVGMVW